MKCLLIDFTLPYLLKDADYPAGGWAVRQRSFIHGLIANGQQAGVLTWPGATRYVGQILEFDLIETYDPNKGIKILKYFYSYIPKILAKTRDYKPDIVIQGTCGIHTGIMAFVAKQIDVPFVYCVANDMDVDERYKERLLRYEQIAYKYGLQNTSAIICQNQYQYDRLRATFSTKPLHIIHNPFSSNTLLPDMQPRSKRKYIAWIGTFSHQKNIPLLYKVASALPHAEFHIAGTPSWDIDAQTKFAIENLKKLKNVKFVGYIHRENIFNFLAGALALLCTSRYEGFSNTILEALASGTPVITPLRIDPDHIVTKNGLGMSTDRDEALPTLIQELSKLEERVYENLSTHCQNYLLKNHRSEDKARELIDALLPLVHSG